MRVNAFSAPHRAFPDIGIHPNFAVRLDGVQHPFGPFPAASEAMTLEPELPCSVLASKLRKLLSEAYLVPEASIVLFESAGVALDRVIKTVPGPLVGFPPSAAASLLSSGPSPGSSNNLARGVGRESAIDLDAAVDLPTGSVALIDSPSDPLGSVATPVTVVRLARACRCLIVDERYAEFAGISVLPLSLEFENIVVLRSFEVWAGIKSPGCAWAIGSPQVTRAIGMVEGIPDPRALSAAIATLEHLESVSATLGLVRQERSRLYRFLRKLSFLEPIPSWGPFLAARVNLVPRDRVVNGLVRRGVHIHAPKEPGLEQFVRIGLGPRSAMDRLRDGLLELAPELVS